MVFAGLLTFLLVSTALRDRRETDQVWVIQSAVPAGAVVDPSMLVAVELPRSDVLGASLVGVEAASLGRAQHDLRPGDALRWSDLVADGTGSVERTITLPVDALAVDGLGLTVGDRLDVIGIVGDGAGVGDGRVTDGDALGFVVTDVAVVRLPVSSSGSAFAAAGSRTSWVTIEVSDTQALALSDALRAGDLSLVRSTGATAIDGGGS